MNLAEPYRKRNYQINDWKYYLKLHSDTLIPKFKKVIKTSTSLPEKFTLNDLTRRYYLIRLILIQYLDNKKGNFS